MTNGRLMGVLTHQSRSRSVTELLAGRSSEDPLVIKRECCDVRDREPRIDILGRACVPGRLHLCPVDAIYYEDDLPEALKPYQQDNEDFFTQKLTGRLGSLASPRPHPVAQRSSDAPTSTPPWLPPIPAGRSNDARPRRRALDAWRSQHGSPWDRRRHRRSAASDCATAIARVFMHHIHGVDSTSQKSKSKMSAMTSEQQPVGPKIVVGVDGSEPSKAALRWALNYSALTGADVTAVMTWQYQTSYGWDVPPDVLHPDVDATQILEETLASVVKDDRPANLDGIIRRGHPAKVLLDLSVDAAMLVVGSRGHGGFAGLLLGSVSSACAEHAKCPVLVVHGDSPPQRTSPSTHADRGRL